MSFVLLMDSYEKSWFLMLQHPLSGLISLDRSTAAYTHLRHSFGP